MTLKQHKRTDAVRLKNWRFVKSDKEKVRSIINSGFKKK